MTSSDGSTLCDVSSETDIVRSPVNVRDSTSLSSADQHIPPYRFRIFKSKGAVLVLLWSFSGYCVLNSFLSLGGTRIYPLFILTMCLLYPVIGWLADVRYGRYKVIKWSLRIMCVFTFLLCIASVVHEHFSLSTSSGGSQKAVKIVFGAIFYVPISLSLGGFQANIIQFGVDQLVDASSGEIISFIRWNVWVWFLSRLVTALSQSCLCSYESAGYLVLPIVITMAICVDAIFNHWLVKEPASDNPFVLIFKVLRYAMKHKYPQQRSAFTYWDDKPFSRIDLGKDKYGGPFTTEQVEDTKTFFRIIIIIATLACFISLYIPVFFVYDSIVYHLHDEQYVEYNKLDCELSYIRNCFQQIAVRYSGHILIIIVIPLFEFVFYPFFKRHFQVSILMKSVVGAVLVLLSLVACIIIEFVAQHDRHHPANESCSVTAKDQPNSLPLDYKWMIVPFALTALAKLFFLISVGEFLCAQSPYSMKGLLFGLTYGFVGLFGVVGFLLQKLVQLITERWLYYRYGCVFWYLILSSAILFVIMLAFFCLLKCYKKRLREDNVHNDQMFAINYYSQCPNVTE